MTKDQLVELILDHYSNRKDAKAYLDFFLEPNTDKLLEKFQIKTDKELGKSKHGYSKAKVTVIKTALSDLESFQPGYEIVSKALFFAIQTLLYHERYLRYSDSHYNLMKWLVNRYLDYANRNLTLDTALAELDSVLRAGVLGTRSFRNDIAAYMSEFIDLNKI